MKYVALLRGVNVGGNCKVPMIELKQLFEQLGHQKVSTYINSGNVIFEAENPDSQEIEKAIEKTFGFFVPVVLRSHQNLEMLRNETPSHWTNDLESKTDILFLWEDIDDRCILEKLGPKPVDEVIYAHGAVVWHVNRKDLGKSALEKLVGTATYKKMTVRNINTLRKLVDLSA